ncbi:hypothetical protein C1I98_15065 [Spongiactinospora gelatinilytica]|uniref:Uncharacterized protein n=1 Tax=Spongiactinospora gelatinilytica TaxID=2666298 RepID=A0A2W2GBU5_9ACTN|nr:hypothetical protein [Spongiactinospora gelatinilytica]PZG45871.1 hypothetical protein C1I98_15065 [Spongiactinospora gelatinilytica]
MNEATAHLLFDTVERLEKNIVARECPAIVALEGTTGPGKLVMSDYDYLRDSATAAAFEMRAAGKAAEIGVVRWVLAVPQVWVFSAPGTIAVRAVSNHRLREGEQEAITWMSFDQDDGIDYGRVAYARRPSGEPVFEEPEMFEVGIRPTETMPGFALLQRCLSEE